MMNHRDPRAKLKANWEVFAETCIPRLIHLDLEDGAAHKTHQLYYKGDINNFVSKVKYLHEDAGMNGVALHDAVLNGLSEDICLGISF